MNVALPPASANGFDELGRSEVQPVRQLHDVDEADVSLATLYATHIVVVWVGNGFQEPHSALRTSSLSFIPRAHASA